MALANSGPEAGTIVSEAVLTQILTQLESLTISQQVLQAKVCPFVSVMLFYVGGIFRILADLFIQSYF